MGFREHLQGVCQGVEGAVACSLMGVDGIEVDTHLVGEADVDVKSLMVEYSGLFRGARDAAGALDAGGVAEFSVSTEKIWTVARMVSPEYFMAVALRPDGNLGKARYLLRITVPKVRSEL
jgi:predicted regulator of Ras-like GTPase activity (Roadblock/LC7/MglB family)